jgi:micrococcal nuclease
VTQLAATQVPNAPAPTAPTSLRYDPNGPDRDCGDFDTHAEAQAFFEAAGGPDRDPHKLDGDHDGIACETLP